MYSVFRAKNIVADTIQLQEGPPLCFIEICNFWYLYNQTQILDHSGILNLKHFVQVEGPHKSKSFRAS